MRLAAFHVVVITALTGFARTGVIDVSSEAADRETQSGTPSKDIKVLNRIFANWNARSERARSVHLAFDYRKTMLKASPGIPLKSESLRCEEWLDGNDRSSNIEYAAADGGAAQPMRKFRRWTDDGKVQSVAFFSNPESRDNDIATRGRIMSTTAEQRYLGPEMQAVWLAFRAVHPPLSCRPDQFRLVTENAIVDGGHYTKIERTIKEPTYNRLESFWVDPDREDLIVHWEMRPAPARHQNHWRGAIIYQMDTSQGWMPSRWKTESTGPIDGLSECVVVKSAINEKFAPSTFVPDFPLHSIVNDRLAGKRYIIEKNGVKRMLSPEDFDRLWDGPMGTKK